VVGISAGGAGIWQQLLGPQSVSWYLQSNESSGSVGGFSCVAPFLLGVVVVVVVMWSNTCGIEFLRTSFCTT
jgi:hypothetical protein